MAAWSREMLVLVSWSFCILRAQNSAEAFLVFVVFDWSEQSGSYSREGRLVTQHKCVMLSLFSSSSFPCSGRTVKSCLLTPPTLQDQRSQGVEQNNEKTLWLLYVRGHFPKIWRNQIIVEKEFSEKINTPPVKSCEYTECFPWSFSILSLNDSKWKHAKMWLVIKKTAFVREMLIFSLHMWQLHSSACYMCSRCCMFSCTFPHDASLYALGVVMG